MSQNQTNNSFRFFANFLNAIDRLPEEKRAKACYEFCKFGITGELPEDENLSMFCVGVSASVQKYQGRGGNHNPAGKNQWSKVVKEVKSGQRGQTGQKIQTETETETETIKKKIQKEKFDEFWVEYKPVAGRDGTCVSKGNKSRCMEKFIKIIKTEDPKKIITGLRNYLDYCKENRLCSCGAEVFLNQRRWENEYNIGEQEDGYNPRL